MPSALLSALAVKTWSCEKGAGTGAGALPGAAVLQVSCLTLPFYLARLSFRTQPQCSICIPSAKGGLAHTCWQKVHLRVRWGAISKWGGCSPWHAKKVLLLYLSFWVFAGCTRSCWFSACSQWAAPLALCLLPPCKWRLLPDLQLFHMGIGNHGRWWINSHKCWGYFKVMVITEWGVSTMQRVLSAAGGCWLVCSSRPEICSICFASSQYFFVTKPSNYRSDQSKKVVVPKEGKRRAR